MRTGVYIFGIIMLFLLAGTVNLTKLSLTGKAVLQNCTPDWQCTDFSECVEGTSIRSCVDINLCGDDSTLPTESKDCTPDCIPNWQCDQWSPETCPENQLQTRTCIDTNTCKTNRERPEEGKTCEYKESYNWLFVVAIIIGILTILLITVLVIGIIMKSKKSQNMGYQNYPRTIPPSSPQDPLQKTQPQQNQPIHQTAPIQNNIKIPEIPPLPKENQ